MRYVLENTRRRIPSRFFFGEISPETDVELLSAGFPLGVRVIVGKPELGGDGANRFEKGEWTGRLVAGGNAGPGVMITRLFEMHPHHEFAGARINPQEILRLCRRTPEV